MSAEVRFGIIGCGLMGREFASVSMRWLHLTGDLPRPVIVAACDASPERLAWFERVPDTRYFYQDYRELLKNPEVEAVYCAVPPQPARAGLQRRDPRGQAPFGRKALWHGPGGF